MNKTILFLVHHSFTLVSEVVYEVKRIDRLFFSSPNYHLPFLVLYE